MTIACDDFGGSGPLLHFSHANGLPPGCYRQLLGALTASHRVVALHHRPMWRPTPPPRLPSWRALVQDLLDGLDQLGAADPIVGVGHSLGAVVSMFAAVIEPARFRALVLIEPVFLEPAYLDKSAMTPRDARMEHPMVQAALRRRQRFDSRSAALANFRTKAVFAGLGDDALADLVDGSFVDAEGGGVELAFSRQWEAELYALPPRPWRDLAKLAVPTLGLRGARSNTLVPAAWQRWQRLQPRASFVEVADVGHLLPMEAPGRVAQEISRFLGAL